MFVVFLWVAALGQSCVPDQLSPPVFLASGADCVYYQSLGEALDAVSFPARIEIRHTSAVVDFSGKRSIAGEVEVHGNSAALAVTGETTVLSSGKVTIVKVEIELSGSYDVPVFNIAGGTLELTDCVIMSGNRELVQVLGGSVSIANSTFSGLGNNAIEVHSASFQILIEALIVANCSDLVNIDLLAAGGEGDIVISALEMSESGRLLRCRSCQLDSFRMDISDSSFRHSRQELISGAIENLRMRAGTLTFENCGSLIDGSATSTTIEISNSEAIQCLQSFFNLDSLSGGVYIENTVFHDVVQGPIVSLSANPYPSSAATVSFQNCSFSAVQNLAGVGALFCCESVTLIVRHVEVKESFIFSGGLFHLSTGVAFLSNINYHNVSGFLGIMFEAVASEVALTDSVFTHLILDGPYLAFCFGYSSCLWHNVTVTDSSDPSPPSFLVFMWTGMSGRATIENCYINTAATEQSQLTMGATDSSFLSIVDSVFEGLWQIETFGSFTGSFVSLRNVTLIRPRLDSMFTCAYTTLCLEVDGLTIIGESSIVRLVQGNSGIALIQHALFEQITDSVVKIMNANVTLTDVTVRNFKGVVCNNCVNVALTLDSFVLEAVKTEVAFQMTFSTLTFRKVTVRAVTCEQFVMLDTTAMMIEESHFEDMQMDSFGGLISAVSSSVLIQSSTFTRLLSTLSMYLGLIYLEGSPIEIRSSTFSDISCTLIRSVGSASVTLSSSQFSSSSHAIFHSVQSVKIRGSVLYAEATAAVTISDCQFSNLAADVGGVLYLSGNGAENCEIRDSAADNNVAKDSGGVLYSDGVNVAIHGSNFFGNSATYGGALALFGRTENLLEESRFLRNYALLAGGALAYRGTSNAFTACEWANNSAVYGPNIASGVTFLSVLQKDTLDILSNYSIEAVSGQMLKSEIVIGCLDNIDQVVFTDNGTKLSLFTLEANSSVIASNLLESSKGVYQIHSLTVIGQPGNTLSIYGTYSAKLTMPLLSVYLRKCIAGEFFTEMQCKLCSHNTYSLTPSQPCTLCPVEADCPAGALMNLHEGYWRTGNHTDEIVKCFVPSMCVGGLNSDCASGYTGPMCSSCKSGYYKMSQLQCAPCVDSIVPVIRTILAVVISLAAVMLSYLKGSRAVMTTVVALDYFQSVWLLAHYNLFWPEAATHYASVAGDLSSFGLTASITSCFQAIGDLPAPYSQSIVLAVHVILVGGVLGAFWALLLSRVRSLTRKHIARLMFYAFILMLPVMFHRGLQMVACFELSGKYYLIYDSSVECWTPSHLGAALSTTVLTTLLAVLTVAYLCLGAGKKRKIPRVFSYWKMKAMLLLLVRKLLLSIILVFSNWLFLSTQVAIVISINIAVESVAAKLRNPGLLSLGFYQLCVMLSLFQSFFYVCYWASSTHTSDYSFLLVYFALQCPPLIHIIVSVCRGHARVTSTPATAVAHIGNESLADVHSVVLEERSELCGSRSNLRAPLPTPELSTELKGKEVKKFLRETSIRSSGN